MDLKPYYEPGRPVKNWDVRGDEPMDWIGYLLLKVQAVATARQVWGRLTASERASARQIAIQIAAENGEDVLSEDPLVLCYRKLAGTTGIWCWLRKRDRGHPNSHRRAAVEIALLHNLITRADHDWLMEALGVHEHGHDEPERPRWDKENGRLYETSEIVCPIRLTNKPSNVVRILDAFEEEEWRRSIDNPIPASNSDARLRDTLHGFNKRLKAISFHSMGEKVVWQVRPRSTDGSTMPMDASTGLPPL